MKTERELWVRCVNHCIENEIIGFHLVFDVFLEMREREGYKLVPVEPEFETMRNMSQALRDNAGETPKRKMQEVYKAMIGAVE